MPISLSTLGQSLSKGSSTGSSILTSVIGARPVYSEHTRLVRRITSDTFGLLHVKDSEQSRLNALAVDNPDEAFREQEEFNAKQIKKLDEMSKQAGIPVGDYNKFTVNYLNERQTETSDDRLESLWAKPRRRVGGRRR